MPNYDFNIVYMQSVRTLLKISFFLKEIMAEFYAGTIAEYYSYIYIISMVIM